MLQVSYSAQSFSLKGVGVELQLCDSLKVPQDCCHSTVTYFILAKQQRFDALEGYQLLNILISDSLVWQVNLISLLRDCYVFYGGESNRTIGPDLGCDNA